ncbi:MAG: response regulator, partial [Bdellovibrionia bacterium]
SFNLISVVAVLHDITSFKKAEKEKDEFLSVASHELKTPLTVIDLSCQIIKKSLKNGNLTQLETANNHLAAQLRRIKLLVLQLFDFANLQSAHFAIQVEKVDLCKLLSRVVEDNRSLSSEHALELQLPTTCPIVLADPTRMEKNIRVLVIDDETAILETTSLVFQLDSGFEVFTLKDSLKWKETIEQVRPQILLLDYRMPHMNGDEVIEALNLAGLRASINVLALFSATPFPSSAIQKLGADVFFEKPFEIEYLLSKLRELFKTSQERDSIVLA